MNYQWPIQQIWHFLLCWWLPMGTFNRPMHRASIVGRQCGIMGANEHLKAPVPLEVCTTPHSYALQSPHLQCDIQTNRASLAVIRLWLMILSHAASAANWSSMLLRRWFKLIRIIIIFIAVRLQSITLPLFLLALFCPC
jgi:hypothetical protein